MPTIIFSSIGFIASNGGGICVLALGFGPGEF